MSASKGSPAPEGESDVPAGLPLARSARVEA
jgi:hypothetical protein